MSDRLQLGIFGHAIQGDKGVSVYHWAIFDLNAASDYILATGCGRDRRDQVTGAWVAVGSAARWLSDSGRTPRTVTVVARQEITEGEPAFDVQKKMRARVVELIEGTKAEIVWDTARESERNAMMTECRCALRDMENVEAKAREAAEGEQHGKDRSGPRPEESH